MRVLVRKLRSGIGQPLFVQLWLLPAWLMLVVCRLLIKVLPFRQLAFRLGEAHGASVRIPVLGDAQWRRAAQIGQVVRLAARYVPFGVNCYPRALAASQLLILYRVPYCLCFGVMRDARSGEFKAHAWTVAGRVRVTGGESFSRYQVLACFVRFPGPVRHGHDVQLRSSQSSTASAPGLSASAGDGTRNP